MLKVVAWDIDDTILDCTSESLPIFNKINNTDKTIATVAEWVCGGGNKKRKDFFSCLYGHSSALTTAIFTEFGDSIYNRMRYFEEAKAKILEYQRSGIQNVFITARKDIFRSITQESLDREGLGNIPLYFDDHKVALAKQLGVDLFYEDNLTNIVNLRREGIDCVLVDSVANWGFSIEGVERVFYNKEIIPFKRIEDSVAIHI